MKFLVTLERGEDGWIVVECPAAEVEVELPVTT